MTPPRKPDMDEPLPARRPGLEIADFDTEFVVFDPDALEVHHVQGVTAVVFDACDGSTTVRSLVEEMVESTGLEADRCEPVVLDSLGDLFRLGLVVTSRV